MCPFLNVMLKVIAANVGVQSESQVTISRLPDMPAGVC